MAPNRGYRHTAAAAAQLPTTTLLPLLLLLLLGCCRCALDPYRALGLERSASDDEIKRAYRKAALKYHPDKNPKGQQRFVEIQQAYEILGDPDKKRDFDSGGHHGGQGQHSYYQGQHQGGQQFHYGGGWHEPGPDPETVLPSQTVALTSSNFRSLVFMSYKPWLMMVFSETSLDCRAASPAWEAMWKSMSAGRARGQEWVQMGRINWRRQQHLIHWMNRGLGGWQPVNSATLPTIVGMPYNCQEFRCMRRYSGPLTVPKLQEFVAEELLGLRPIPAVSLANVEVMMGNVPPFKVVALAFGKSEGQGSLALRALAKAQASMMHFSRVAYQEADNTQWQAQLGLKLPPAPFVVFMRGPGVLPEVLPLGKNAGSELEKQVEAKGLFWQALPPLRPATAISLGCTPRTAAGPSASGPPRTLPSELCVVAVGARGPGQHAGRAAATRLLRLMWDRARGAAAAGGEAGQGSAMENAAQAIAAGTVRITWLDADTQGRFCSFHFGGQQGPEGRPGPCNPGWWEAAKDRVLRRKRHQPMYLMAFKPAGTGTRRRPPTYLYASLPSVDLSSPSLSEGDVDLAAQWLAALHALATASGSAAAAAAQGSLAEGLAAGVEAGAALLRPVRSGQFPPELEGDEGLGVVEGLGEAMSQGLRWIRSSWATLAGGGDMGEATMQGIYTVIILLVLGFLHVVWFKTAHPEGQPPRPGPQH